MVTNLEKLEKGEITVKEYNDLEFPVSDLIPYKKAWDKYESHGMRDLTLHFHSHIDNYKPNPIAEKLGYVCPDCKGIRTITPLFGEKVCLCLRNNKEAIDFMEKRRELCLYMAAQISFNASWMCRSCNKYNELYGQTEETTNTCNYCGNKQPTEREFADSAFKYKVKIIQCSRDKSWYENQIGVEFKVYEEGEIDGKKYCTIDPGYIIYRRTVSEGDFELINDNK